MDARLSRFLSALISPSGWLPLLALLLISFVLYAPSLGNSLIWDSSSLIHEDLSIRDLSSIPKQYTSVSGDYSVEMAEGMASLQYYRPIVQNMFTLGYAAWQVNPMLWHLLQVMLHLVMVALVYLLLRRIFNDQRLAFFATLLFAVHPGKAEGVIWVYGLSSQLVAILLIATLLCWLHRSYFGVALFTVLALFSRETAVLIPLLLVMAEFLLPQGQRRWHFVGMTALLVAGYLLLRTAVVGDFPALSSIPAGDYLLTLLGLISTIGMVMLLPIDGVGIYPFVIAEQFTAATLFGAVIVASFLALALYFYRKADRSSLFWMAWSLLWVVLWFNLGGFGLYLFTEKAIYLAVLGPIVILCQQLLPKRYGKSLLIALALLYFCMVLWRGSYWSDQLSYFKATVANAPEFPVVRYQLGLAYASQNAYPEAVVQFKQAVESDPGFSSAHNNLGNTLWMLNRRDEAAAAWKQALATNQTNPMPAYNLGMWAEGRRDNAQARYYYGIYLRLSPDVPAEVRVRLMRMGIQ